MNKGSFLVLILFVFFSACTVRDVGDVVHVLNGAELPEGVVAVNNSLWGSVPFITLDSEGNPFIAFYDGEFGDLVLAYEVNNAWVTEVVDSEGDVGKEKGLAVDSSGVIHLGYQDRTNRGLKYAVKNSSGWFYETLDTPVLGSHVVDVDLALDNDELPHVVYNVQHECNNGGPCAVVKHAWISEGEWLVEEIGVNGNFVQVDVDDYNTVHASFNFEDDNIRYACRVNNEWLVESINDSISAKRDNALVVDSEGVPHLTFHDSVNGLIKYAVKNSSGWFVKTIASGVTGEGGEPQGLKMGLTNDGSPVILALNPGQGSLLSFERVNNEWVGEELSVTGYPSIIIDSENILHLACTHGGSEDRVMSDEIVEKEDEGDFEYIVYTTYSVNLI